MFVDASAMVAILTEEPEQDTFSTIIEMMPDCVTSAVAIWETVIRLMSKRAMSAQEAQDHIDAFLRSGSITIIPIGQAEAKLAVQAYDRFGKGRHPAGLNMGDCFAYACAKAGRMPLLYKGNDFMQTDIASAAS